MSKYAFEAPAFWSPRATMPRDDPPRHILDDKLICVADDCVNWSVSVFFFAGDTGEPPHVHVERDNAVAKYWLDPVALASSRFFPPHELRRLHRTVQEHSEEFMEAWNGFFGR